MGEWNWNVASGVADTVTAISAVAGVIIAAVLGLRAIRIAVQDRDTSAQEFMYTQVDGLLQSGLGLTSATRDLSTDCNDEELAIQAVDRNEERFQARLRTLQKMHLIDPGSETAIECDQFANLLVRVAKSNHELLTNGRHVLASTIFDGDSDGTNILENLANQIHGHSAEIENGVQVMPASDGQGVSPAFDGSSATALQLRSNLAESTWNPSVNQSLRLIMPWVLMKLEWIVINADEDGNIHNIWDYGTAHATRDPESNMMKIPPHPAPVAAQWLQEWPRKFWQASDHGDDPEDDPQAVLKSPEEIASTLFNDVRIEFINHISELAHEMRMRI